MFFQSCGPRSGSVGSVSVWVSRIWISQYLYGPDPPIMKQIRKKKILISTVLLLLYDISSLKTDVNVPSNRNQQKNLET